MNLSIWAGQQNSINVDGKTSKYDNHMNNKGASNTVYAGGINLLDVRIEQKRKEAQKKAWKVVSDAWDNDKNIDRSIEERREHYEKMRNVMKEYSDLIVADKQRMEELKEIYNVLPDSQEQQDLDLLIKEQNYWKCMDNTKLTKEEWKQLEEIHSRPLTEYQQMALNLNDRITGNKKEIEKVLRLMQDDVADITSISIERLKSHAMADANNQADAIMAAAGKEIIGMVVEEAKENIDEKLKEEKEKAEKAEDEKEEKEEHLEKLEEKQAIQEALILKTKEAVEEAEQTVKKHEYKETDVDEIIKIAVSDTAIATSETQQSLEAIKNSMKLLEADLKGIKVDEQI